MSRTALALSAAAGVAALAIATPSLAPLAPVLVADAASRVAQARTTPAGQPADQPGAQPGGQPTDRPGATRERPAATPERPSQVSGSAGSSAKTTAPDALTRGVVYVATTTATGEGAGTGMVLTADGQVLTNYHVVEGSTDVSVTVATTGRTYTASVVGHDATADVALLQLAGASGLDTVTPDRDPVRVGETLTAVGNASGRRELVAASGSVTGLDERVTVSEDEGATKTLQGVIATTAGAVPGDSGGPMFDQEGEVSGMTTAGSQQVMRTPGRGSSTRTSTTASFAVPIGTALDVVERIRSGAETGTVRVGPRALLGVGVDSTSLVVSSVSPGGPAERAGLTVGSEVTAINGRAVTTHDELAAVLETLDPGQRVAVVWTDAGGARRTAQVELGRSGVN